MPLPPVSKRARLTAEPRRLTVKTDFHRCSVSDRSFIARVRHRLPDLHPAERRLAEQMLEFPGEMASYSASELAELSGVSNATVTRFVQSLGYRNFSEARRHAREEARTGSRLFLAHAEGDGDGADWLSSFLARSHGNLDATFSGIAAEQIDAVADAVLEARRTFVIGFRSNHAFATYLQWQMTQAIEHVSALPGGGETMGEHLVSLTDRDVAIVFGLRRRSRQLPAILDAVERSGARLLYITDEAARFRPTATWHFRCETLTPGTLFDHVAVTALSYVLVSRILRKAGARGRARLRAIEALNEQLSEL